MGGRHIHSPRSRRAKLAAIVFLALRCVSISPQLSAQQLVSQPQPAAATLVLEGVTVIDVNDGQRLSGQTIVIAGNRVHAVGPASQVPVPSGAQVVDARGKYLIPGLWDMHTHTEYSESADMELQDSLYRRFYPAYIANGVTGIREMAQRFPNGADFFRRWQHSVMAGTRVGPRAVGPSADLVYNVSIETPDDARRIIDSLKAAGDAFAKYHDSFGNRELFFAIAREARRVGLPLVGHVPRTVTNVEASDSGMRSVEHVQENHQCRPDNPATLVDSIAADERCAPVVKAYIDNGTWMVPTLAIYYYTFYHGVTNLAEDLLSRIGFSTFSTAQRFVRMTHRLGIKRFLAGTDCAEEPLREIWKMDPVCHCGFTLLQELVFLTEAGLTPLEALQAATLNPAKFLNATDSLGTVAPGKLADLVLLDGDPLTDIHNVMHIRAVLANGRYFDRAALDTLDPEGVERAKSYAEQLPSAVKPASSAP